MRTVEERQLSIHVDAAEVPAPKRPLPPARARIEYPFTQVPVGGSARFPRARRTVIDRLWLFYKTPEGRGTKFVVRALTPTSCRVWRLK